MKSSKAALVVALTAAALTLAPPAVGPGSSGAAEAAAPTHPNVVFILTDDMRFDDMQYLPFTRRLLRRTGTEFRHTISQHPLCCPARAGLVTGQYAQNNGVRHNKNAVDGGYDGLHRTRVTTAYRNLEGKDNLLFQWFQNAGYATHYSGKFLNGYEGGDIPGLADNDIAIGNIYSPWGLVTWNNGDVTRRRGHQTHAVTNSVLRHIRKSGDQPFFTWAGYVTPHSMWYPKLRRGWLPPIPPKGYDSFRRRSDRIPPSTRKASFNAEDWAPDAKQTPYRLRRARRVHHGRVLSLYAVDDAVRRIVRVLKRRGEYDDTILVFTSDNGMALGSHKWAGKNRSFQDSLRVPMLMAGPGIPVGEKIRTVTTLLDLPGTLARLTGVTPTRVQDGGDMFSQPEDRAVLIQAGWADLPWYWRGIYTKRYTYTRYEEDGTVEFHDRATDPDELVNLSDDPRVPAFETLLESLGDCAGAGCTATDPLS